MKTVLIGCGRIGFLLENDPLRYKPCTHFGGMKTAGLAVTHACDIDRNRLALFSKKAGIPADRCHRNNEELLHSEKPEFVVIATWTESHESIAVRAAENGARVVVLEKPITSSLKGARRLLDACSRNGTGIIVNHERRYDNRYRSVRKTIESGIIGSVKTVNARILTGGHRGRSAVDQGGGPLLHDGTHLIDIIRYLFGEIIWVEGEFSRNSRSSGYEDRAVAWCRMEEGTDVFLEAGGGRDYFVFELEISGTDGKIIIGNGYQRLYQKRRSSLYSGFNDLVERPFSSFRKNNCFTELYREAKVLLKKRECTITSTGDDGYRALEAVHAIYLSSHSGMKRIPLPVSPKVINLKKIFNLDQ